MSLFISHLIDGAVGSTILLMLAIMLGSFFIEDLTAVIVGILAADGIIPIPLALFSLYIGVLLSDTRTLLAWPIGEHASASCLLCRPRLHRAASFMA